MNEEMRRPMGTTVRAETSDVAPRRGGSRMPWIVIAVVVVVIVVLAILFRDKLSGGNTGNMKATEYQAVFLTNGQVYFGKLSNPNDSYVKLTDIFYLQVQNPPIQGSQQQQQQQAQPQLSLVKLGNELHGPKDEMHISRDQILFYEDMKDDGKVVKAIKEYKANPNAGNTAAPQGSQATPPATQQTTPPAAAPANGTPTQQTTPPAAPKQ